MSENLIDSLVEKTMIKIKEMVDVNTIVGTAVKINEGVTVIPISKLTYGFAMGGSEFPAKKEDKTNTGNFTFGGGTGAGVTVSPVAFLVINKDDIKLLKVEPCSTSLDKALDVLPSVLEKIKSCFKKDNKTKDKDQSIKIN